MVAFKLHRFALGKQLVVMGCEHNHTDESEFFCGRKSELATSQGLLFAQFIYKHVAMQFFPQKMHSHSYD